MITKKSELLSFIYQGTRFKAYRNRILNLASENQIEVKLQKELFFQSTSSLEPMFHLKLNSIDIPDKPFRFFLTLLSDFYRPIHLGEIFNELYNSEYFDPFSSNKRLHEIFRRAKKIFATYKIDLFWKKKQIGWTSKKPICINLEKVQSVLPEDLPTKFSISDVQEKFNLSKRQSYRKIKAVSEKGLIRQLKPNLWKKVS